MSFPTASPSGDQVLQSFQQVYFISNPKKEEMSKNSLKIPCSLQAVLGPLLRCGCTCANLLEWTGANPGFCSSRTGCLCFAHSRSTVCISPAPAAMHLAPVWQERASKAELPSLSALLGDGCLLLVQQEMLWKLCSFS